MNSGNVSASALPAPASPVGARRPAAAAAAAFVLSLITLMFWVELLMEGDRAGSLGALRWNLLALAIGFPAVVQIAVCAGAPFAALSSRWRPCVIPAAAPPVSWPSRAAPPSSPGPRGGAP